MALEPLYLSLFLLAAVCGVARFRGKDRLDQLSLRLSHSTSLLGTLLLSVSAVFSQSSLILIPLSLLVMMHASTLVFRNYFLQIICLPLIIAEILGSYFFVDFEPILMRSSSLIAATVFHLVLLGILLKLIRNLDATNRGKPALWSPYSLAMKLGPDARK